MLVSLRSRYNVFKRVLSERFSLSLSSGSRVFGEAYRKEDGFPELLAVHLKGSFQSLLVLLAAKACKFPIWLRPLWICATWISTLFWKQLGEEKKKERKKCWTPYVRVMSEYLYTERARSEPSLYKNSD